MSTDQNHKRPRSSGAHRAAGPEAKGDRVLVSTVYSDGTPLPSGWTVTSIRVPGEAGVRCEARRYEARRNGNLMKTRDLRLEVDNYIRGYEAAVDAAVDAATPDLTAGNGDTIFHTLSTGAPLPAGWVIRYHADKQEYVAYYQNVRKGQFYTRTQAEEGVLTEDAEHREAHLATHQDRMDTIHREAEKALKSARASAAAAKMALTALPEKKVRRSNRLLVLSAVGGALVGALLTGGVLSAQAPEQVVQEVTPVSCWQALTHADDLRVAYSNGITAALGDSSGPRAKALDTFVEESKRLTPLYDAARAECLAFKQ